MKIQKIVIFTIDSLYSNLVLDNLVSEFGDRITMICLSDRYAGKHGSFLHQLKENFKRSGLHFVNYLSIVFVYYKFIIFIFNIINNIFSSKRRVRSIKQLAKQYNIRILKTEDINKNEVEEIIKKVNPDLIISIFFDQLIRENIFTIPKFRTINVHPGLLPDYRGPFPTFWALKNGEKEFGLSIHYVDSNFDTGDIILREKINIGDPKSVLGVDYKIYKEVAKFTAKVLNLIESNNISAYFQKNSGVYYSFPSREDIHKASQSKIKLFTINEFIKYFI